MLDSVVECIVEGTVVYCPADQRFYYVIDINMAFDRAPESRWELYDNFGKKVLVIIPYSLLMAWEEEGLVCFQDEVYRWKDNPETLYRTLPSSSPALSLRASVSERSNLIFRNEIASSPLAERELIAMTPDNAASSPAEVTGRINPTSTDIQWHICRGAIYGARNRRYGLDKSSLYGRVIKDTAASSPAQEKNGGNAYLLGLGLSQAIKRLAIPAAGDQIIFSLLFLFEMFIIGRLGVNDLATMTVSRTILNVAWIPIQGIVAAMVYLVAQAKGAQDENKMQANAFNGLFVGIIFSFFGAALAYICAPYLFVLFGAKPEVIAHGIAYFRIFAVASIGMNIVWLVRTLFKAAGDANKSFYITCLAVAATVMLLPLLTFGLDGLPRLGLQGAGWA